MLDLTDVYAYVDAHEAEFFDQLVTYLRQPSISAQGIGIAETAAHIAGVLTACGFAPRIIPTDGWPMVFAERRDHDHPGAPTVLIYGHYDVQPPDPLDQWVSPPFEPTVRDGKLYARGVGDNKGQHLAQILGAASLLAVRGALPCNVKILLEGEEEIGSPQMPPFVLAHREMLAADLAIISDGPVEVGGRSTLKFGVRGVLSFELRARGAKTDLHSGNWGGVAPNPLWTLVHLLGTMKNDRGEITIDGLYDAVDTPTTQERAALAALPVNEAAIRRTLGPVPFDAPPESERSFYERLAFWPTFTINGLHGGYGGAGSKTVLPHEAFAKCDIRLVASQTADDITAKLRAHIARHAPDVEIIFQGAMDPSKTPLDSPFAVPLIAGITDADTQGDAPLIVPAMGGSLPEYVFTRDLGIPTFGVPYANADEANHAPNENLEVRRFFLGIKTSAAILAALGNSQ